MRIVQLAVAVALVAVACATAAPELATTRPETMVTVPATSTPPSTVSMAPTSTGSPTPSTTSSPPPAVAPLQGFSLELVTDGIDFPVAAMPVPGTAAVAVVAKEGRVYFLESGEERVWLDISDRVTNRGEQGLLDIAFAADFVETGRFFVHYTDRSGDTVLSEFSGDSATGLPDSEVVLFRAAQPAANHNGGPLAFGPDGTLYLALGDGGGANDQFGNGQRTDTPLGGLLRFDVSTPGQAVAAVGNPFLDGEVPELWAYGLRNPWSISFDEPTGLFVVADVGQNLYEEINIVKAGVPALNYGWPIVEGLHCFSPRSGCDPTGTVVPAVEVSHDDAGTCSITGGFFYRGQAIPELIGRYLYSDYCGGWLRAYPGDQAESWDLTEDVGGPIGPVVGFGTDTAGEPLILTSDGRVLRLVARR